MAVIQLPPSSSDPRPVPAPGAAPAAPVPAAGVPVRYPSPIKTPRAGGALSTTPVTSNRFADGRPGGAAALSPAARALWPAPRGPSAAAAAVPSGGPRGPPPPPSYAAPGWWRGEPGATAPSSHLLGTVTVGGPAATGNPGAATRGGDLSGVFANRNRLPSNTSQPTHLLGSVTLGGGAMANANLHRRADAVGAAFGGRNLVPGARPPLPPANLLGTVTVGGGALGNAGTNLNRDVGATFAPPHLLGTVTLGGASRLSNANRGIRRAGEGGAFAHDPGARAGRGAPPLLPRPGGGAAAGRAPPVYPPSGDAIAATNNRHRYTQPPHKTLGTMPTAIPRSNNRKYDDFENEAGTALDSGDGTAPSHLSCAPEAALTTDLVTLSLHEALTFNGVELALHPDVFAKSGGGPEDATRPHGGPARRLRPGDLVEVRVWSARPGATAAVGERPGGGRELPAAAARRNLHSRTTSLATVSSSISNITALMQTPRVLAAAPAQPTPPVPRLVGGSPLGPLGGGGGSPRGLGRGERPPALPPQPSSIFSGASSLFRKVASSPAPVVNPPAHSRDSSLAASATLPSGGDAHSRDSSIVTINSAGGWMAALHGSASAEETAPSPSNAIMESVSEGPSQSPARALIRNRSCGNATPEAPPFIAMRKSTSAGPSPPLPPHPLSSSGASTPASHSSSPRHQLPRSKHPVEPVAQPPPMPPTASNAQQASSAQEDNQSPSLAGALATDGVHTNPLDKVVTNEQQQAPQQPALSTQNSLPPPSHAAASSSQKATKPPPATHGGPTQNEDDSDPAGAATKNINDLLQSTHFVRVSFVLPVSEGSLSSIKSGARTQVSLLRNVADLYAITAYDTVTVTQITRGEELFVRPLAAADFLTVTLKDQFVSRGGALGARFCN